MALARGQTDAAIARFKSALLQPALTYGRDAYEACLADAYLTLGRLDEAAAEYERILRLNPRSGLAHFHLAEIFERKGERAKAREAFNAFLGAWRDADSDAPMVVEARRALARLN